MISLPGEYFHTSSLRVNLGEKPDINNSLLRLFFVSVRTYRDEKMFFGNMDLASRYRNKNKLFVNYFSQPPLQTNRSFNERIANNCYEVIETVSLSINDGLWIVHAIQFNHIIS